MPLSGKPFGQGEELFPGVEGILCPDLFQKLGKYPLCILGGEPFGG